MSNVTLCACGHPRHEGRCAGTVRYPGNVIGDKCPCTALTKPVENVSMEQCERCNGNGSIVSGPLATTCSNCGGQKVTTSAKNAEYRKRILGIFAELRPDPVLSPYYYRRFPNGVEPRHIAGHLTFHVGTALVYLARAGFKGDAAEDLKKARTHIDFELERLGVKP